MQNEIKNLPQDWLLIADGEPLSSDKLKQLAHNKKIMVLDGAYEYIRDIGIAIDVLLGDFDSINPEDLAHARKVIKKVIDAPDQNKTDLEKGLEYIDNLHPNSIVICAAIGLRLQHTIYNLRLLKKYYRPERPLTLISAIEIIHYYQNTEITLSGKINDSIGLLGFPYAIVTTSGLKWDMRDQALAFEKSSSVLNVLMKEEATIKISGDALVIHEINVATGFNPVSLEFLQPT